MPASRDLVEDWIAMRSVLVRQTTILRSGALRACDVPQPTIDLTTVQVEKWIAELNTLLKLHASVDVRAA